MNGPSRSAAKVFLGVWALFLALAFVQVGNGLQRILLPLRADSEGFGAGTMGVVMAFHFAGYLVGAKVTSRALVSVGHIRVFAALASLASVAVLVNAVLVFPVAWSLVYLISGACNAGVFVVLESWLNDRATNETRGRILGGYMVFVLGGTAAGQLLANLGSAEGFRLFILASALVSLAVVPVTLSASTNAPVPTNEAMSLRELYRTIPAAVVGISLGSFVQSAVSSMGAVFATESGMEVDRVTLFTAAALIGAVILQMPLGWASDRHPRRAVILVVASVSCGLALLGVVVPTSSVGMLVLNLAFGACVFPLYGQFVALANDWIPQQKRAAAASTLVFISGCGAVAAPIVIGPLMGVFGPDTYFFANAVVLGLLVLYLGYRTKVREAVPVQDQSRFQPLPARAGEIAHSVERWSWSSRRRTADPTVIPTEGKHPGQCQP